MQPINEHINRLKNFEPNLKIINTIKKAEKDIVIKPAKKEKECTSSTTS